MQATVRQFVQTYWRETLEAWRKEGSTKLHFYSQRVLYNAENSGQELGDNVFVLYEDETVKRKKDVSVEEIENLLDNANEWAYVVPNRKEESIVEWA